MTYEFGLIHSTAKVYIFTLVTELPSITEFQYFVEKVGHRLRKFFLILAKNTEIFCYFPLSSRENTEILGDVTANLEIVANC